MRARISDTKVVRNARAKEWKQFRKENLLTQERLAGLLGVHRTCVSEIERANTTPRQPTLKRWLTLKAKYNEARKIHG